MFLPKQHVFFLNIVLGRDDKAARCILFYKFSDVFRLSTMVFTEQTGLAKLYEMVGYSIDANRYPMCCHVRMCVASLLQGPLYLARNKIWRRPKVV